MFEKDRNNLSKIILDAAVEVHQQISSWLLESVCERCLCKELSNRNIAFERQVYLPIVYKNETLEVDFRIDILVKKGIIIELKVADEIHPVHHAQLPTYLQLHIKDLGY